MKSFYLSLVIYLLCCPCMLASAQSETPIDIRFTDIHDTSGPHRAPSNIPVEATYYGTISSVIFTFSRGLGNIDIDIDNTCTGEHASTSVNANEEPFVIVHISGDKGHYVIQLNLTDGKTYHASFDL